MERYDSYKDSGVKWLGQIPSHWEVKHLRNFLTLFSEKGYGDCQLLSVTREKGVILRDKDNKEENHNFVPDDLSGYKHLNAGDFVINKMKSWQGSYGVSEYEGIVSPAYFTCKLHGVKPSFFSRAIRSKAYIGFFMQYSKGIRVDQWDLDPNSMKDIPFILPPIAEQDAIVTYLDTATAKIDAAILQQQKMIDLLNERKQIIINNAVTKGLNPNVKMKDSGVEWLGEIPSHWELRKMKFSFDERSDKGYPSLPLLAATQNHGVIRKDNYENRTVEAYKSLDTLKLVEEGDFVISLRSFQGGIELCHEGGIISPAYTILRPTHIESCYFKHLGKSHIFIQLLKSMVTGIREGQNIDYGKLRDNLLPIPSPKEQDAIANYLDNITSKIDEAIAQQQKAIDLLKERKQIIINEVVTGKVKVS